MQRRFVIRMLLFIVILLVLNVGFAGFGVHEHIDVSGSIMLTLALTGLMMAVGRVASVRRAGRS